jgi:hypothetical protein
VDSHQQLIQDGRTPGPVPVDRNVVDSSVGATAASAAGRVIRLGIAEDSTCNRVFPGAACPPDREIILLTDDLVGFDGEEVKVGVLRIVVFVVVWLRLLVGLAVIDSKVGAIWGWNLSVGILLPGKGSRVPSALVVAGS